MPAGHAADCVERWCEETVTSHCQLAAVGGGSAEGRRATFLVLLQIEEVVDLIAVRGLHFEVEIAATWRAFGRQRVQRRGHGEQRVGGRRGGVQ